MLISIHWIHCILTSIELHRHRLPWKFLLFSEVPQRKQFKGTSSTNPFQSLLWVSLPALNNLCTFLTVTQILWTPLKMMFLLVWYSQHKELAHCNLYPSITPAIYWFLIMTFKQKAAHCYQHICPRTELLPEIPMSHRKPPMQWKHNIFFSSFLSIFCYTKILLLLQSWHSETATAYPANDCLLLHHLLDFTSVSAARKCLWQ